MNEKKDGKFDEDKYDTYVKYLYTKKKLRKIMEKEREREREERDTWVASKVGKQDAIAYIRER